MDKVWLFRGLLMLALLCWGAFSKECINIPTQLSSHILRFELLASSNDTWRLEMFSYYHLVHSDEETLQELLPRKVLREEEDEIGWTMIYRKMKSPGWGRGGGSDPPRGFLKEVSLHSVRLEPSSIQWRTQQTNLEY